MKALAWHPGSPLSLQGDLPLLPPPPTSTDCSAKRRSTSAWNQSRRSNGVEAADFGKKIAYAQFTPNVNIFAKSERTIGPVPFGSETFTHSFGLQATWELWANGSTTFCPA